MSDTPPGDLGAGNSDPQPKKPAKGKPLGRPFKKGQSGNPSGLSKTRKERIEAAKEKCLGAAPDMIDVLIEIARSKFIDPKERRAAASDILDRALGKAVTSLEVSGPDGAPVGVTDPNRPSDEALAQKATSLLEQARKAIATVTAEPSATQE